MRIANLLALSLAAALGMSAPKPISAQAASPAALRPEDAITLQVSTGTYKRAADGTDEWTEGKSFQSGSQVWARVAITNLTDHVAFLHLYGELPMFETTLLDNGGAVPELTVEGCRMHFCPQAQKGVAQSSTIVLSGLGPTWIWKPKETIVKYFMVTYEYQLTKPGAYEMSLVRNDFQLSEASSAREAFSPAAKGNTAIGPVRSNTVKFQILP